MFARRLVILLVLLALGAAVLVGRLAQLQILQAEAWRAQAVAMVNRHSIIETSRGAIRDRYGRVLAQDVPCYNLAIDYRAMNMDDIWIEDVAVRRLKAAGVKDRRERLAQLPQAKAQVAEQIEDIPHMLARVCALPGEPAGLGPEELQRQRMEMIQVRFAAIRERMDALRQSQWTIRRYDRDSEVRNSIAIEISNDKVSVHFNSSDREFDCFLK